MAQQIIAAFASTEQFKSGKLELKRVKSRFYACYKFGSHQNLYFKIFFGRKVSYKCCSIIAFQRTVSTFK